MKLYSKKEIFEVIDDFVSQHEHPVVEILGPTGSGKTTFGIEVAQYLKDAEVICVDSRQVFIDIDVSSAKVTEDEMDGVLHWGIDLLSPEGTFSVVDFQKYAFEKIDDIHKRKQIPILCGGTMLWLDAVSENYIFGEGPEEKSTERGAPRYPILKIGIEWDRKDLYDRLNARAEKQFNYGLIEETQLLREKYDFSRSALTSFGYKEIMQYLDGEISKEDAITENQKRNRNYAKRQLTWWRGREDVLWVEGKTL
jgi:tRNA dimethylallyltransferase